MRGGGGRRVGSGRELKDRERSCRGKKGSWKGI